MNEKWFSLSIEQIEKKLKTNAASGLSVKAARSRCSNKERPFFTVKKKRIDKLLLDLVSDFFLIMLLFISVFSLFFDSDRVMGSAMLVLIIVNLSVSFFIYYRDRRALESMSEFFTPTARVIRGGKLYISDYRNVAVGDVIIVERGDILGCDARLIHSDRLSVKMKLDKKSEKILQKYAGGVVAEGELYAENMTNMLHAGSTVVEGSGRAIVVATGEYTYLGAMTGGMTEVPSGELPEGLVSLKKNLSGVGMLLLILTLPFCIFSLMFGHFTGGTVFLSEVLAVVLSIGATATLSRFSNLYIGFFSRFIRRAALAENPCIIRSAKAFDTLAEMDYLFMLDGSITTDGILHFDGLATVDGDTNNFEQLGQSAKALCDMIALYSMARSRAVGIAGAGAGDTLEVGIKEFMTKSRADTEALKIRCQIQTYLPRVDGRSRDMLTYTDKGERRDMTVAFTGDILDECSSAFFGGIRKDITDEGREALKRSYQGYLAAGKRAVIFTLKDGDKNTFVGMLLLHEGIDTTVAKSVSALRRNGVKIITFSNCVGREHAPEIPAILRRGGRAYAGDFLKQGKSITHDFGSFDEYCGFDENSISQLARYVKEQNKCLAVLGFSDYAAGVIEQADIFISCAPVKTESFGHFEQEIRSLEMPGEQSSASCTQAVKAEADILLMRPHDAKGGLEPLARTMEFCKAAYGNLKNYVTYLVCAQIMRLIAVAFPMLFGNSVADARQLLLLGFVLDIFAMLIFMYDPRRSDVNCRRVKNDLAKQGVTDIVKSNAALMISAAVGGALTLLLPNLFGMFSFFGSYIYRSEFTFISLALMQMLALTCVYSRDIRNVSAHRRLIKSRIVLIGLSLFFVFTALCLLTPIGDLFGIVSIGIFYLLLSIAPAIAFGVCFWLLTMKKQKGNVNKL